jgi:hypothetical protein
MEKSLNAICTVIAANYIPQALTLEESVKEFNPDQDFFVLVVDALTRDISVFKHAQVLIGSDLLIDQKHFEDICGNYDLFEASTAVKPSFFRTLLAKGYDSVTFLDPDTQLFSGLEDVFELNKHHSIVLTPHRISPTNPSALNQREESFLRYGTFNLGFISVNQDAANFLLWWEERLHWSCRRYSGDVVYTDQKWIDLVPSYFSYFCLRQPGYNLAPWNLDERPLSYSESIGYMCGSEKLVFIHYSQMSSTLARGEKSNLWEYYQDGQDSNETSIGLAKKLTDAYAGRLLNNKKLASSIKLPTLTWPTLSFHLRAFNIERAKSAKRVGSSMSPLVFQKLDPLVRRLERLDTFNSLVDGITRDLRRLSRKRKSASTKK